MLARRVQYPPEKIPQSSLRLQDLVHILIRPIGPSAPVIRPQPFLPALSPTTALFTALCSRQSGSAWDSGGLLLQVLGVLSPTPRDSSSRRTLPPSPSSQYLSLSAAAFRQNSPHLTELLWRTIEFISRVLGTGALTK